MIAYIIALKNFKDEEYFIPREVFEKNQYKVVTFSTKDGNAIGVEGGKVEVLSFDKITVDDYEAIVMAGGPGALQHLDNEQIYELLNQFQEKRKLIAAICISPIILAKAGILKKKKATVWSSKMDKTPIKILEANMVNYKKQSVVEDGLIITADGPDSAFKFAKKIVEKLDGCFTDN